MSKSAKIWADSGYVGKIDNKIFFFQCLVLPKDRQSFCEVQKKNVIRFFQKILFYRLGF
jgi:hypothetical protein